ncbi:MAG: Porphobilinogen deaminase [bacterium ADurb.Bin429]|nr:MAG: Porphobilinogen deaminase [bacterium ADurb.Bin429]
MKEIEQALLDREVDLAVHSMKDLPGEMPDGLIIAAVPPREDTRDVLVGPLNQPVTLAALPTGARLGTSSLRRKAQILALRPDLTVLDMRGNVDTRLRKLDDGQYDAVVLAAAGLHRLGLAARIHEYLPSPAVLPAAGQGALAIQTRTDDTKLITALAPLNDDDTMRATRAERTVLAELGGGCSIPLGVLATVDGSRLILRAALCNPTSDEIMREELAGDGTPEGLGREVAARLRSRAAHFLPNLL